jgi:hypothetical protein
MTEDRPSELLSALPRSRPHRRSDKRPARATAPEAPAEETTASPDEPAARHTAMPSASPEPKTRTGPSREKAAGPAAKSTGAGAKAKSPRPGAKAKSPRTAAKSPRTTAKATGASAKSPRPAAKSAPRRLPQPAQPRGVPRGARGPRPEPKTDFPVLRTALQAAAELTEIGVTLSAKAVRGALGRLPRP